MADLTPEETRLLKELLEKSRPQEQEPLSPEEIATIRKMVEDEKRVKWLWASVRIWSAWVAGAIIGAYSLWEVLGKFIKIKIGG